jgi:Flp pilus assembly pilin Flp
MSKRNQTLQKVHDALARFFNEDAGPTSVEYAIMASLVVGVVFATVVTLGLNTQALFQSAVNAITGG